MADPGGQPDEFAMEQVASEGDKQEKVFVSDGGDQLVKDSETDYNHLDHVNHQEDIRADDDDVDKDQQTLEFEVTNEECNPELYRGVKGPPGYTPSVEGYHELDDDDDCNSNVANYDESETFVPLDLDEELEYILNDEALEDYFDYKDFADNIYYGPNSSESLDSEYEEVYGEKEVGEEEDEEETIGEGETGFKPRTRAGEASSAASVGQSPARGREDELVGPDESSAAGASRRSGGTEKRGVNVIPHALTNQLVACMRGTLDMHQYIVSTAVQHILDSKPFADDSTASGGEKKDLEKEMEAVESYNPEIVHTLVTYGKNMYLDILKSQTKKYSQKLLKNFSELEKYDSPDFDKSRRQAGKKLSNSVSSTKYVEGRVKESIAQLRKSLDSAKVSNITDEKLKSEFMFELAEYEGMMREFTAEAAAFQGKLIEKIMEKFRESQSAKLVPVRRLSNMPKNILDSTDHAATLQKAVYSKLLLELEKSAKESRAVNFKRVELTSLGEGEDNMTLEDLSDRDSFVMPERVRKVVDESEEVFLRLLVQQLVLTSRLEEVLMELMLSEAARADSKLLDVLDKSVADHRENVRRSVSDSTMMRSESRRSSSRAARPSQKVRRFIMNRMRKISVMSVEKMLTQDPRTDVVVSDEVDLAFRRSVADHVSAIKNFVYLLVAKKADSKALSDAAEKATNIIHRALEDYRKKANEVKPPPSNWDPEKYQELVESDDDTETNKSDARGGGAGSARGGSRSRSRSASRTKSDSQHRFIDDSAVSESRSVGGKGGTNSKQGGLLDGEGMAPLNDYLAPEAANNDAQPTTMVTSGPSDGQHADKYENEVAANEPQEDEDLLAGPPLSRTKRNTDSSPQNDEFQEEYEPEDM